MQKLEISTISGQNTTCEEEKGEDEGVVHWTADNYLIMELGYGCSAKRCRSTWLMGCDPEEVGYPALSKKVLIGGAVSI